MADIEIYIDGSASHKPRTGGLGFKIIYADGKEREFSPMGYKGASIDEMELKACILALREIVKLKDLGGAESIIIYSDSQYVVRHHKDAMFRWPDQKWIRSNGEPVMNTTLWKELMSVMRYIGNKFHRSVYFEKVSAHSGIVGNESADKLAKLSRSTPYSNRISKQKVRRKLTKNKTLRGSIRSEGQRMRIRVTDSKWLSEHKEYRHRCEVISKGSPYFENIDFMYSPEPLQAGHVYDVRLANQPNFCRIEKVFREIVKKKLD